MIYITSVLRKNLYPEDSLGTLYLYNTDIYKFFFSDKSFNLNVSRFSYIDFL